ncbi:MAG TPA: TolC family protein [Polyangiales bacterium]|nr:TolC family protein [Polyangiales bacterium]
MLRLFVVLRLVMGMLCAEVAAAQDAVPLVQMLREVRAQSPSLVAARARITAAKRAWDASGRPADPMLSVELDRVGGMAQEDGGPMLMYMIEQPIPTPGTLGMEERVATKGRERAEADLVTLQRDLDVATARAYVMLWRAQGEIVIVETQRRLLEEINAVALARMQSGADTHHDIIQTQVAGLALQNDLTRMAAERDGALAMLNALRNRPESKPFAASEPVPSADTEQSIEGLEREALLGRAELRSMSAMAGEERAMAELMRREGWPMFSVGAFYNHELEMMDSVGFVIRGTLPIFGASRQSARAAVSEARALAFEAEREAMGLMIRGEVRSVSATYRAATERVSLLRDVTVPRAEEALAQAQSSYRTGMMPFASVIQDQRMLVDMRMELIGAKAARFETFVALMRSLGRDLSTVVAP